MFLAPFELGGLKTTTRTLFEVPSGLRYAGTSLVAVAIEQLDEPRPPVAFRVQSCCNGWANVVTTDGRTVVEFEALPFEHPSVTAELDVWPTIYMAFDETPSISTGAIELNAQVATGVERLVLAVATPDHYMMDVAARLRWLANRVHSVTNGLPRDLEAFVSACERQLTDPIILRDGAGRPRLEPVTLVRDGAVSTGVRVDSAGDLVAGSGFSREELEGRRIFGNDTLFVRSDGLTELGGIEITSSTSWIAREHLPGWLAEQQSPDLARWTTGNMVVPFLNAEVFDDVFTELSAVDSVSGPSLMLSSVAIDHVARLSSLPLVHENLQAAIQNLIDAGGESRVLAAQLMQFEPGSIDDLGKGVMIAMAVLFLGTVAIDVLCDDDLLDATTIMHLFVVTVGGIIGGGYLEEILELLEPNTGMVEALAALGAASQALLDPYPAISTDNHLSEVSIPTESLVRTVMGFINHFSVFHQKIAVINNDTGLHAYAGSVDFTANRLDDFEHAVSKPFKDLHARIDGPAVRDLAHTFIERWNEASGEALATPAVTDPRLAATGGDVVQVARTYFEPHPSRRPQLSYAPNGERTIYETMLLAIQRAQEFIYIEDPVLTPPREYQEAIRRAIGRGVEVIILVGATPDQPFGTGVRRSFIESIPGARVGVMRRGYNAIRTVRAANMGRFYLDERLEETPSGRTTVTVPVKPAANVPNTPFWFVVDDELMWAAHRSGGGGDDRVQLVIDRGSLSFLGADENLPTSSHKAGAAATVVDFASVQVGSCVMIVDDMFVSMGSAQASRRGLFADGECNIFTIPARLRLSSTNWIRGLRKRLWSEALNIPERIGDVLLEHPADGFALFDRARTHGNRFVDFGSEAHALEQFSGSGSSGRFLGIPGADLVRGGIEFAIALAIAAEEDVVFDVIVDPSSYVDPAADGVDP